MSIKRFGALALIAVIVVAIMSLFSIRGFAQTTNPTASTQQECDDGTGCDTQDEVDDDDANEDDDTPTGEPAITAEEAQAAAEAYLADDSITREVREIELESEHGKLLYSVEFTGIEVEVDAMTGEVLGTEIDRINPPQAAALQGVR